MIKYFLVRANTNDDYFDNRAVAMLVVIDEDIIKTAIKLTNAVNDLGVYQISIFDGRPIGIPSGIIEDEDLLQTLDNCDEEAIAISEGEYNEIIEKMGDDAIKIESMTMQVDNHSVMWDGFYKYVNIPVQSGHINLTQLGYYGNRSCATCSLGQEGKCELDLDTKCISNTDNKKHKDYWIDKDEE